MRVSRSIIAFAAAGLAGMAFTSMAHADAIYVCEDGKVLTFPTPSPEKLEELKRTVPCVRAWHERQAQQRAQRQEAAKVQVTTQAPIAHAEWRAMTAATIAEERAEREAREAKNPKKAPEKKGAKKSKD